ncbi:ABC transporter permease [Solilutibacter silvestris]|uniref:Transport permease protein n=1 Tax=Solilutibacter silvestris TaxID=1645665 RepID=A0A2K1Q276_9GAMM|nr:ABC transporter permease [Lysobacter silvestris]PNS09132.1 ABC-2 type transporter [Lysobacter silvestris]
MSTPAVASAQPSRLRIHALEARNESLRMLRSPMFVFPTLMFPLLFYVMFGLLLNHGNAKAATYLYVSYGVFGTLGTSLFGFGVSVANERNLGHLLYKRALPMPPSAYLIAKLAMAMLFATIISISLFVLATTLGGVHVTAMQFAELLLTNVLGVLPLAALGLYIGTRVPANGAPAVINLVYLPMSLLSGLWMPLSTMPPFISKIAMALPPWHLAQIAFKVVGYDSGQPLWLHVAVLAAFTIVFFLLAQRRLQRNG